MAFLTTILHNKEDQYPSIINFTRPVIVNDFEWFRLTFPDYKCLFQFNTLPMNEAIKLTYLKTIAEASTSCTQHQEKNSKV